MVFLRFPCCGRRIRSLQKNRHLTGFRPACRGSDLTTFGQVSPMTPRPALFDAQEAQGDKLMITLRNAKERGVTKLDWLDSRHTFSFGEYFDPKENGFSVLRVINDDRVAPGMGFGTHPHRDMEIISYVLEGTLEHKDSMGNGSQLKPGQIQLMSAGRGITHSEFNPSRSGPLHFLQIWIQPQKSGLIPSYTEWHPKADT